MECWSEGVMEYCKDNKNFVLAGTQIFIPYLFPTLFLGKQ